MLLPKSWLLLRPKVAEPIVMPFGVLTPVGPMNRVLHEV